MKKILIISLVVSLIKLIKSDYDELTIDHSFSTTVPESCEWDSSLKVWYFSDQYNHKIHKYSSSGVKDSMEFSDDELDTPAGIVVNNGILYVASFGNGKVISFNTTTGDKLKTWDFDDHNPNGLCLDDHNEHSHLLLYVTDAGLSVNGNSISMNNNQGMWVINLDDDNVTEIFNSTTLLYPNGCTFNEDEHLIYVVQTNLDSSQGNNQIFKVSHENEEYSIIASTGSLSQWNNPADGIIFSNDGDLFVTTWGTNFGEGDGYINVYNGDSWNTILTNLSGPADIGYDFDNNRICIPNMVTNVGLITTINEDDSNSAHNISFYSCFLFFFLYILFFN